MKGGTYPFVEQVKPIREVYPQGVPLVHVDKAQADVFERTAGLGIALRSLDETSLLKERVALFREYDIALRRRLT